MKNNSIQEIINCALQLCEVITDMPCACDICPLREDYDDEKESEHGCGLSECIENLKNEGMDLMNEQNDEEAVFVLTPHTCLILTLESYGINTDSITPKIGEHIIEDFMDLMIKQGYIKKTTDK